ncbi:hypothetical protein OEV98_14035 [Caldibacillus lycopersici]|uniref:Uncharacterized protein n=1 Tax=Perspicuibacillus lycopersici TaxID=1325689 RepID=A0AAE3IWG5_9BACI|nr:CBO0543 family protein [Perspicuibacillus lycopersici]MCU9614659.1 hypothetical protein [Perspicuibacillus lycopersici]
MDKKTLVGEKQLERVGEIHNKVFEANKEYLNYWLHNTFLHWDFWLSFVFTVAPWVVFIIVRKKTSTHRLLYVGLFAIFLSSWFDFLGVMYGLWYYTGKVFPSMPSYMPWDFSILPVFIMLLIQFKPNMKAHWKGVFFATVGTCIGEPFFKWLGFYVTLKWNGWYSFAIYFFIYVSCHRLSRVSNFDLIE